MENVIYDHSCRRTVQQKIQQFVNFKKMIHDKIFTNQIAINRLIYLIQNNFIDTFNIEYDIVESCIKIKIKKTNIKKSSSYKCSPSYYYPLMNNIFYQFFSEQSDIIIKSVLLYGKYYNLNGDEPNILLNLNNMQSFYNLALISDNILVVYI